MTAIVQFLNVGWGDAHLIQLPSGSITLIDGGDGVPDPGRDQPLSWMNRTGIDRLDWMILTHIHEDHLNGLIDIAKSKTVAKAILPYEPFELPREEAILDKSNSVAQRVYGMLVSYLELIRLLTEQGTDIHWRNRYASDDRSVIWSEDGFTLSHLYPWVSDPLPAYELLKRAISDHTQSLDLWMETLERFFNLSNHDSSVYRLTCDDSQGESVLFGGDQLEPGWVRLAQRIDLKSRFWKVSHHGMEDGFNSRILSLIEPEHCIIPISRDRSTMLQSYLNELRPLTDASFHLTGLVPPGESRTISTDYIDVKVGY